MTSIFWIKKMAIKSVVGRKIQLLCETHATAKLVIIEVLAPIPRLLPLSLFFSSPTPSNVCVRLSKFDYEKARSVLWPYFFGAANRSRSFNHFFRAGKLPAAEDYIDTELKRAKRKMNIKYKTAASFIRIVQRLVYSELESRFHFGSVSNRIFDRFRNLTSAS